MNEMKSKGNAAMVGKMMKVGWMWGRSGDKLWVEIDH